VRIYTTDELSERKELTDAIRRQSPHHQRRQSMTWRNWRGGPARIVSNLRAINEDVRRTGELDRADSRRTRAALKVRRIKYLDCALEANMEKGPGCYEDRSPCCAELNCGAIIRLQSAPAPCMPRAGSSLGQPLRGHVPHNHVGLRKVSAHGDPRSYGG
jgi:hypothetical protein